MQVDQDNYGLLHEVKIFRFLFSEYQRFFTRRKFIYSPLEMPKHQNDQKEREDFVVAHQLAQYQPVQLQLDSN